MAAVAGPEGLAIVRTGPDGMGTETVTEGTETGTEGARTVAKIGLAGDVTTTTTMTVTMNMNMNMATSPGHGHARFATQHRTLSWL